MPFPKCPSRFRLGLSLLLGLSPLLGFSLLGPVPNATADDAIDDAIDDRLSSYLPHDVPRDATPRDFETFSWRSFIALNWPADPDGRPAKQPIGTDPEAPRVWEYYPAPDDVFLPDGSKPTWPSKPNFPQACRDQIPAARLKDLPLMTGMTSKASQAAGATFSDLEAIVNKPLVDRNLNFILAEIRLNRDEFDYIVKNRFYDAAVQEALKVPQIQLPAGKIGGPVGAVEIKAAWRFLDAERDGDILGRYYTQERLVYVPPQDTTNGEPLCIEALLGLVGFHIAHKTETRPEWIWSTFEQVDNVKPGPGLPPHRGPTLRDMACNDRYMCPVNQAPPSPFGWNSLPPYAIEVPAVQALRYIEIPPFIQRINKLWQRKLRRAATNSPWQYYELVGTQWPQDPDQFDPAQLAFGNPFPTTLSNTTLETFLQPTSSCIQCHGGRANMAYNYHTFPDFTFLLAHACFPLAQRITTVDKPCDALALDPAVLDPGGRIGTRQLQVTRWAGSFELVCDLRPQTGTVDVTITSDSGAVPFADGSSVTASRQGVNRFPLRPPNAQSPAEQPVSFVLHNQGAEAVSAACTIEPY